MDRRDFIKTIGAGMLIPVMPVLASTPDLKTWFEKNFDCRYGQPGPYVVDDSTDEQYRYKTFAVGVTDSTESDAEKRLSQYFIDKFLPLAQGNPKLWWRIEPQFAEIPFIKWGETWMTAEEVEDNTYDGKLMHRGPFYPKRNWHDNGKFPKTQKPVKSSRQYKNLTEVQIPKDVEYDFDTGSYKYVLEKHVVHRMRFRLAIPSKDEQIQAFKKEEGEMMENI